VQVELHLDFTTANLALMFESSGIPWEDTKAAHQTTAVTWSHTR
jgi:hypothetical protein